MVSARRRWWRGRRAALLVALFASLVPAGAARAEVSVLTMTPGPRLFERFGHTALRVGDRVYNFGTFDGDDPQLVRKFLGRQIDYWLSVRSLVDHFAAYDNRVITEQVLALEPAEERELAARLERNALPQNRAYRYDFFLDNCATRVRDAVDGVAGGAVARAGRALTQQSYRRLVEEVLAGPPLLGAGVSLLLNRANDVWLSRWEAAFLPRELSALLADAVRSDGRKLVLATHVYRGGHLQEAPAGQRRVARAVEIALELALLLPLLAPLLRRPPAWGRGPLGTLLVVGGLLGGLLGAVVLVASLTPYPCARWNDQLVLLHPGLLLLVPAGVEVLRGRTGTPWLRRARWLLTLGMVTAFFDPLVAGRSPFGLSMMVFLMNGWARIGLDRLLPARTVEDPLPPRGTVEDPPSPTGDGGLTT